MKKKLWIIIAIVVVIAAIVFAFRPHHGAENPDGKPIVKIGVNVPMTGDVGLFGHIVRGSVDLARQDMAHRDLRYRYEFIFEDNQFDTKRAAAINNKFVSVNKVDAIMDLSSNIGLLTSKIAEENKILHINVSALDPAVAKGKYSFVHWTPPENEVALMMTQIKNKGARNVVIFTAIDHDTIIISDILKNSLTAGKIKFTEFKTNPDERNLLPLVQKTESLKPDLYILVQYPPVLDLLLRRLRETNTKAEITAIESFDFLEDPNLANNLWFVTAADISDANRAKFVNHLGTDNLFTAGNTYDSVMLIVQAFETASDKESAADNLNQIKNYTGIMGELRQDARGIFHSDAQIKIIKNGKPETVKE